MWASIFTIFWGIFGDKIMAWLKSLFDKAAKELPAPETFGSQENASLALIEKALEKVGRRPFKRLALLFMKRNAVKNGKLVEKLDPEAEQELKALGSVGKKLEE